MENRISRNRDQSEGDNRRNSHKVAEKITNTNTISEEQAYIVLRLLLENRIILKDKIFMELIDYELLEQCSLDMYDRRASDSCTGYNNCTNEEKIKVSEIVTRVKNEFFSKLDYLYDSDNNVYIDKKSTVARSLKSWSSSPTVKNFQVTGANSIDNAGMRNKL